MRGLVRTRFTRNEINNSSAEELSFKEGVGLPKNNKPRAHQQPNFLGRKKIFDVSHLVRAQNNVRQYSKFDDDDEPLFRIPLIHTQTNTPSKEQVGKEKADETNTSIKMASNLVAKGVEHHINGKFDDALNAFQIALKEQINCYGQEHRVVALTLENIGAVYLRQRRLFLSWEALNAALDMKKRLREQCKNAHEMAAIDLSGVLNNLGNIAYLREDYSAAMRFYRETVKELWSLNQSPEKEFVNALHNIGRLHVVKEEWNDALSVLSFCKEVEDDLYGSESVYVTDTLELLGFVHLSLGSYDNAMVSFSRALSIYEEKIGPVNEKVALSLINVGMVVEGRGDLNSALMSYQTARDVFFKLGVAQGHRGLLCAIQSIENVKNQLSVEERRLTCKNNSSFLPIGATLDHATSEDETIETRQDDKQLVFYG